MDVKKPWSRMLEPTRIWGNLWFVGGYPASVHILETGEGLVLFDCGYQETLYLVLDGMRRLNLDPGRITDIFITHGHIDHCGAAKALQMLYGCKIWISAVDAPAVRGENETDLTCATELNLPFIFFEPDGLLRDGDRITRGNTEIRAVATPGHTAGAMSYFFDITDGKRVLRAGLHGGAGFNSVSADYLTRHGLPFSLQADYVASMRRLMRERVDVFLGNHVEQNKMPKKYLALCSGDPDAFVNAGEWVHFLEKCVEGFEAMVKEEATAKKHDVFDSPGKNPDRK